jgi:hypothetical protein
MRISATAFARIRDEDDRYCLLLNKGRLRHNNERVLSPVGGALEFDETGGRYLVALGATDFESGNDIRCQVPDVRVESVFSWFMGRQHREITVLRELREELTTEAGVLTDADLVGVTEQFMGFYRYDAPTARRTVASRQTAYFIEVFDVTLPPAAMQKLLAAAEVPLAERWVYFATTEEIRQGMTHDGVVIGPITTHLL